MASVPVSPHTDSPLELHLLPVLEPARSVRSWSGLLAIALAFELAIVFGFLQLAQLKVTYVPAHRAIFHATHLYLPADLMTQRAPNRAKPTPQIDLADLMASRQRMQRAAAPAPAARHFEVPRPKAPETKMSPTAAVPAPDLAANAGPLQPAPGIVNGVQIQAPPPPSTDHPFQDIGSDNDAPRNARPTLRVPKASVDGALQSLAQTPDARRLIISDGNNSPRLRPGMPGAANTPGTQHMEVELKSDSEAPDFREYLTRVLAIVRANWKRVTPESVRLGTLRGQNTVELVIDRDGSIPKLVIGQPSNLDALDRASVAGVSMSNPLPPLPADFKGQQVRIAFTFQYNMPQ